MPLFFYNTLTRSKEPFVPLREGFVGMYVCGPTVYGHSHLGHAKSYVSFDVIVRYLRSLGNKVLYVQNITDVGHLTDDADEGDDKIEKQSRVDRVHPMQIADEYTRSYYEDMDRLNVARPEIAPRATGHITEQIAMIENLVAKHLAYAVNGSVYFDVASFAGYGKLSGRTIDEMSSGTRVEVKSEKRHPSDFALWKKAEPGHVMHWPSPWGEGFPGWHIECSAMSMKYLGETFDIHGGGMENQFPHHECEIAQSEGSTGKPFVKYWLHNNMVTVDGRKMGKSLGNFITLKDAFERWSPMVVRFFILQSHYRSTLDFSGDALEGAGKGLEKLTNCLRNVAERRKRSPEGVAGASIDLEPYRAKFIEAMDDDVNTPQAVAVLFDLARDVNSLLAGDAPVSGANLLAIETFFGDYAGNILGLNLAGREDPGGTSLAGALMELIIGLRAEIRLQKLWPLSDRIRDGLQKIGIALEDRKDGTTWKNQQ